MWRNKKEDNPNPDFVPPSIKTDRTIDIARYYGSIYINRKLRYLKHNDDTWQDMETNDTYSGLL